MSLLHKAHLHPPPITTPPFTPEPSIPLYTYRDHTPDLNPTPKSSERIMRLGRRSLSLISPLPDLGSDMLRTPDQRDIGQSVITLTSNPRVKGFEVVDQPYFSRYSPLWMVTITLSPLRLLFLSARRRIIPLSRRTLILSTIPLHPGSTWTGTASTRPLPTLNLNHHRSTRIWVKWAFSLICS